MFKDLRAAGLHRDESRDRLEIELPPDAPPQVGTVSVGLLLDKNRHLVGVDVGGDVPGRWILLLGEHEDVAGQVSATVSFERGRLILEQASQFLARGVNPYVR